jgi:hypothetical protein
MPLRKPHSRYVQIGVLDAFAGIFVVDGEPKRANAKPCLQTLFLNQEVRRTALLCGMPGIQASYHQ